ncbi:MAG TPA: N-acetylneuraminate synthase [Bacteroidales bacterium]|nr:N-acetylneuraminate synthase [Bacteroidales bacterium]
MIKTSLHTLIIAEAGVNHNGKIDIAFALIDAAASAGADYVKFQTFKTEELTSRNANLADYQKANIQQTKNITTQYEMLKKLELSANHYKLLIQHCKSKKIGFLSSPFDISSIELLKNLGLKIIKIPSGEITNYPYLKKIGELKFEIIMSTGMATLKEIEDACQVLINSGTPKEMITLLHCNTAYPSPFEDVNLKAMITIKNKLKIKIGYSDHTTGIEVPIAAVALGAKVIEKHITLNKSMNGPDHKASLTPKEFKNMVQAIRNIEKALGSPEKKPTPSEIKNIHIVRKSIHFANNLPSGHIITENDLIMKRPGNGISPMLLQQVIGKKLKCAVKADTMLSWELLI